MEGNFIHFLKSQGRKLLINDILLLEDFIKEKLPNSYRNFLIENNGGEFDSMHLSYIKDLKGGASDIHLFLGIDRAINSSNIIWNLALLKESCPSNKLLPIASDSGGGLFCLSFDRPDHVSLVFVPSPFDEDFGIYFVSDSFEEFIDGIFRYKN